MAIPLSLPGILTVVIFTFTLTLQEFVYALTFISSSDAEADHARRGDRPHPRRRLLLGRDHGRRRLIASIPVAIAYNLFLDRFIAGITGGAVK